MSEKYPPWRVPLLISLLIGVVAVGGVVFGETATDPPPAYPDRPESLNQANAIDFVTSYERVHALRELARQYGSVQPVSYDVRNRTVLNRTGDGYVIRLTVSLRWDGAHVEGDRLYAVNYAVNSSAILRAEANATTYPGPDPLTHGTRIGESRRRSENRS